jgi:hypothetical protein
MYEKDLHELKTKYQMEENLRRKELEDRIKNIQSAKDDLIGENSKMNAKIGKKMNLSAYILFENYNSKLFTNLNS